MLGPEKSLFWLQKVLFKICFVTFSCCLASASKCILHSRASASNDRRHFGSDHASMDARWAISPLENIQTDRWHLQQKQVAACTVTFRGPGAGICRRQLRSAPGPSGAARRRLGTVCFSSRILLLARFFYLVYLHIYLRCTAIATRRKGRFSEPRKFKMGSKINSKILFFSVHFCKRSILWKHTKTQRFSTI